MPPYPKLNGLSTVGLKDVTAECALLANSMATATSIASELEHAVAVIAYGCGHVAMTCKVSSSRRTFH